MGDQLTEGLKKTPFASYDIVVYFGGGLFIIPFINRYLFEPLDLKWPEFKITLSSNIASEAISILASLFSIYILGHILAYVSSQLIEKFFDRTMGKISSTLILATQWKPKSRNESIRAIIYDRLKTIKSDGAVIATLVRGFSHLPALPIYAVTFTFGIFSYYETRLTKSILDAARGKLQTIGIGTVDLTIRSKWFKPLEYYVVNRYPAAAPRMYNYLVISGLFRTLSLVFLSSMWALLYYLFHFYQDNDWFLRPLFNSKAHYMGLVEFITLSVVYSFCFFSYIKFQRRYAEEAIFAFVFSKD